MKNPIRQFSILLLLFCSLGKAQNFWEPLDGAYGGTITSLTIDSQDRIYAGALGNVYRSTDNGDSWTRLGSGLGGNFIQALATNAADHIFAGTLGAGIFRSTDHGETWTIVNNGLSDFFIWDIAINNSGHIFAATSTGVFRSIDNGDTWTSVNNGLSGSGITALAIDSSGHIFAGTFAGGVYRSIDNGESWTQVNNGLTSLFIKAVDVNPTNNDIFVGTNGAGAFRSTDNGDTWSQVFTASVGLDSPRLTIVDALKISLSGIIFIAANQALWASQDGGTSFSQLLMTGIQLGFISAMACNSLGYLWMALELEGIWVLTQLTGFPLARNIGITSYDVNRLLILKQFSIAIIGTYFSGFFITQDFLTYRQILLGATYNYLSIMALIGLLQQSNGVQAISTLSLFIGTAGAGIFRSTDNGDTWTQVNNGLSDLGINSMTTNGTGQIFAATATGIYRSSDNGDHWTAINNGLTELFVTALASYTETGELVAGTISGNVFRSTDNGDTWVQIGSNLSLAFIGEIAINSNGHIFLATFGDDILRSTDHGTTWTQVNTGLTNTDMISVIVNSSDHLFVTSFGDGVFRSLDNGETWEAINSGLSTTVTTALTLDEDEVLYVGTGGGGVYRSMLSTTAIERVDQVIPRGFTLEQNYPNPFNPGTTIRFSIPYKSHVELEIYNSLGEHITSLISKQLPAGTYKTEWNAEGLPSGVYFYRLRADGFRVVKKMILLK